MSRLEKIEAGNWREFVDSPLSVMMLGKSDCDACAAWTTELEAFLDRDEEWNDVRFGKILLDKPGLIDFKRANPWIADLDHLPFNQVWRAGERSKSWAGGGIERLTNRLTSLRDAASS